MRELILDFYRLGYAVVFRSDVDGAHIIEVFDGQIPLKDQAPLQQLSLSPGTFQESVEEALRELLHLLSRRR